MKPNGRHQVVSKPVGSKAKDRDEFLENIGGPLGKVGVARVRAAYARTERTAGASRIIIKRELILRSLLSVDPRNWLVSDRHQWVAVNFSTNHRCGKLISFRCISTCLLVNKLPELADVLLQLAYHKISAV